MSAPDIQAESGAPDTEAESGVAGAPKGSVARASTAKRWLLAAAAVAIAVAVALTIAVPIVVLRDTTGGKAAANQDRAGSAGPVVPQETAVPQEPLDISSLDPGVRALQADAALKQDISIITYNPPSGYHEGDVGSPSLVAVPGVPGGLMAANDMVSSAETQVHRSSDGGKSWRLVSIVPDSYWGSLFFHGGALYLLGTSKEYGDVRIWQSLDLGETWTTPSDNRTGMITAGEYWHRAPTPIISHSGRLWHAMESFEQDGEWPFDFEAAMWSIDEDADLMDASEWTVSNLVGVTDATDFPLSLGLLEGNAVVGPQGDMKVVIRVHTLTGGAGAILNVTSDGAELTFHRYIDFPGGAKKFMIQYDEATRRYWTLSNVLTNNTYTDDQRDVGLVLQLSPDQVLEMPALNRRNALALLSSADLENWTINSMVLYNSSAGIGYQYPSSFIQGDDLYVSLRTAMPYKGQVPSKSMAGNLHTFHRIPNFRDVVAREMQLGGIYRSGVWELIASLFD